MKLIAQANNDGTQAYPSYRIRIYIRVQDDTGIACLTMFERDVTRIVSKKAATLFAKMNNMERFVPYPEEFNQLLDKQFVFKVNVSDFNLNKNYKCFTINRLTDNEEVIKSVLKRSALTEDVTSEVETPLAVMDLTHDSNDSKEVVSVTEENGTPFSMVSSSASSPPPGGKRNAEAIDHDVHNQSSTTKIAPFSNKLKQPKLEKPSP